MQETGLLSGMLRGSIVPESVTLRSILLATDFSEFSTRALGYALGIASRYKAHLHLFHCIDPTPYGLVEHGEVDKASDDARRELEKLAADFGRQYTSKNVQLNVVVESGDLAEALRQSAQDLKLDVIVIGTHGQTGWRRLVLGSTAETIMSQMPCPVLSVGPFSTRTRIQEFGPENIVLACEAANRSRFAESYALSLARKYGSRLTEVNVLKDRSGRVLAEVSQFEWYEPAKKDNILHPSRSDSLHSSEGIDAQSNLILDVADQTSADLIVLTAPANLAFSGRLRSTNAYRVITGAACPVLTVCAENDGGDDR